jgi:hypothetical protein
MQERTFKAATIVTPGLSSRLVLEAAFNDWATETKPANILHVHYYHDVELRVRGYQVVYEEPRGYYLAPKAPPNDEPARMLA